MIAAGAKPLFEKEAKRRMVEGGKHKGKANLPQASKGKVRDHAAKALDVSPQSVETASKVNFHGLY